MHKSYRNLYILVLHAGRFRSHHAEGLKGKGNMRRSSLSDDHALDALLAREAKDIVEDVMCPFRAAPELSFVLALSHRLYWLNNAMMMTLVTRVEKHTRTKAKKAGSSFHRARPSKSFAS